MDSKISITSGNSSLKHFCSSNLNFNCSRRLPLGAMGNIPVDKVGIAPRRAASH